MLKKILENKILTLVLAFCLPIIIFVIALSVAALINGNATTIFTDAGAQYVDFLAYYKNIWNGSAPLTFSLSGALGSETLPLIAYYLMSPFNFLLLLFPMEAIPFVFYLLIFVRLGLTGITAYIFFNDYRKEKEKEKKKTGSKLSLLIFSTSYALCGFIALYFWNIMWLDAVMLLPLIALGIKKLVRDKKVALYVVTLIIAAISNYYTGWMLGIFSILWFGFQMFLRRPEEAKCIIKKFIGFTLLAVVVVGIVLIPTAMYMFGGTGVQHIFLSNFLPSPRFFLPDILGQLTTGAFNGVDHYIDGLPNIFIGTALTIMMILFFMNKKIKKEEKVLSGVLLVIFVASMWLRMLNSFWHGGAIEFWFPTRYSFVLSFFLIYLAFRNYQEHEGINKKQLVALIVIYGLILLSSVKTNNDKWLFLGLDFVIAAMTIALLKYGWKKRLTYLIIAFVQFVNLGVNIGCGLRYLHTDEQWDPVEISDFYEKNKGVIDELKREDSGFYRTEKTYIRSMNDAIALNYRGVSQFSSTANVKTLHFLSKLGYFNSDNTKVVYLYGETPLSADSFLGIKYILSQNDLPEPFELVFEKNDLRVYKNPYALPLGMIVDRDYGIERLATDLGVELFEDDISSRTVEDIQKIMEEKLESWERENVSVELDENEIETAKEFYEKMTAQEVRVLDESNDTQIVMEADVIKDNQELLLTVAYTPGWSAYVDGEQVRIEKVMDALIAVPLEEGKHTIKFVFRPRGVLF